MAAPRVPLLERFEAKVDRTGECWIWTGAKTGMGYGAIQADAPSRKMLLAHRAGFELFVGAIPEQMELDHLCRNPACVNPDHLEVVTHAENMRRADIALGVRSAKTDCPHGHPYTSENTFVDKRGKRYCRTCQRLQSRRRRKQVTRSAV